MKAFEKYPKIVTVESVIYSEVSIESTNEVTGEPEHLPARGLGYPTFTNRIHCAWLVFTGRADALIWPGKQ